MRRNNKNNPNQPQTASAIPREKTKHIVLTCRITSEQSRRIIKKAGEYGISQSDYIRALLLGEPLHPRVEVNMINELRRTVGLLKHIFNESKGVYSQDTAQAIRAAKDYMVHLMVESKRGVREQLDILIEQAIKK